MCVRVIILDNEKVDNDQYNEEKHNFTDFFIVTSNFFLKTTFTPRKI